MKNLKHLFMLCLFCMISLGASAEVYLTIKCITGTVVKQCVEIGGVYKYHLDNDKNGKIVVVTFNGKDVTADVTDGKYTTPKITGNSEIYVEYDNQSLGDTNLDGKVNVNDITATAAIILGGEDGDDDSEEQSQVINKDIIGVWYCTFQQESQDGDTWSFTYEPSSEYMMAFEDDGTGYMKSGRDELFEIGTHGIKNFNWYGYRKSGKNMIHTDVYDGQDYEITSISSSSLTLTWREPDPANDYTIVCNFIKMK